jgi:hypothetical protein
LGTLVGVVGGAIGANALEHRHHKKKEEQYAQEHQPQSGYGSQPGLYPNNQHSHGHHHHHHSRSRSRSRGLEED